MKTYRSRPIHLILACTLVLSACAARPRQEQATFSEDEIIQTTRRVEARLEQAAKVALKRPPLRASAAEAADADAAAGGAQAQLAACLGEETPPQLAATVLDCKHGSGLESTCAFAALDQDAGQLDRRCGMAYAARVARAAGQATLVESRVVDNEAGAPMRAIKSQRRADLLLTLHARVLAERGQVAAALRLLLDNEMATIDTLRGRPSMHAVMSSSMGLEEDVALARMLLADARLDAAALDGLAAELDTLIASLPPLATVVRASETVDHLPVALAALAPERPLPAGITLAAPVGENHGVDDRQQAAAALLASEQLAEQVDRACPTGSTFASCLLALEAADRDNRRGADAAMAEAARIEKAPVGVTRAQLHDSTVAMLRGLLGGSRARVARLYARHLALLSALRIELEVRRHQLRTGRCPSLADLDGPPFVALRSPAELGQPLALVAVAEGSFRIDAPVALRLARDEDSLDAPTTLATVRCGAGASPR